MNSASWYKTGKTIPINDLSVFYQRGGMGTPLLCLHGFPSSSWDFAPVWPELTKQFDCIASDLIGLGKSAKPKRPLTIALQADVVESLLAELGIKEAHIFAHDLGDTVAQELLARQAEGSSKINWLSCIFMNGGLFPETHQPLFIQKLLLSPLGPLVVNFMSKKSLKRSFNNIFSKAHPPADAFIDETWSLITHNKGKQMIPRLIKYMQERRKYRSRWVQPLVDKLVPIRFINGAEDPISGKHAGLRFEELVPDANVVYLNNAGHYPHVETPDKVLEAFFDFHQ